MDESLETTKVNDSVEELINNLVDLEIDNKFKNGQKARDKWAKKLDIENLPLSINEFNLECDNVFNLEATIELDRGKRQTTIEAIPTNIKKWNNNNEKVYIITINDKIVKIGGTRTSMKIRFNSYKCGFHVIERGKSGKMSVTNAHLYHTIEKYLIETKFKWNIYTWTLPIIEHTINILGIDTKVISQTFHAYESIIIKKFKSLTDKIPILCSNSDPNYK